MKRVPIPTFGLALLLLAAASPGAFAERLSLEPRPGVALTVDLQVPAKAAALVLLLEGGGGRAAGTHAGGFAATAHHGLADRGLATALIDAPSDQRGFMGGMSPRFRQSAGHMKDLDTAIAALREKTSLPVWLLGISLGTRSAAWYASQRPARIDGLILLSSSTRPPKGQGVQTFALRELRVPLLAVAHEKDGCKGTPPGGAKKIVAAAKGSPAAEAKILSGGRSSGRQPCGLKTHHVFYGMEDEVLSVIAAFVTARPG
jgi:predicted alpha/beta-hydrolase family hydrolase